VERDRRIAFLKQWWSCHPTRRRLAVITEALQRGQTLECGEEFLQTFGLNDPDKDLTGIAF
jgi:hypothetical protein